MRISCGPYTVRLNRYGLNRRPLFSEIKFFLFSLSANVMRGLPTIVSECQRTACILVFFVLESWPNDLV